MLARSFVATRAAPTRQQYNNKQSFFGLGTGGLQIKIRLTGTPETNPDDIFYVRHRPSWKVRKNVFTALRTHAIQNAPTIAPGQQQQLQLGGSRQQQQQAQAQQQQQQQRVMCHSCNHDTEGEVSLNMPHGKKLDHMGIQVKFFGRIDMVSFS